MEAHKESPPVRLAVSVPEAAEMIGVSESTIYRYEKRGHLRIRRLDGRSFVLYEDLVKLLRNRCSSRPDESVS